MAARSTVYALAVMLVGGFAQAMISPFWNATAPPAIIGPWPGDQNFNLATWWFAYTSGSGKSFDPFLVAVQVGDPIPCTELAANVAMHEIRVSASSGFICLPSGSEPGKRTVIGNRSGQPMTVIPAPGDSINGAAFNYLAFGTTIKCFTPAANDWRCMTES
jgi:hypothetical protein